ncbi:hypothetical protein SS50377_27605 [Spironucleus salmonicida]|uniref:Uncharacterized protein n=1 Tax=Spironucleus salmonicida TaxID=348837 RepID=V6LPK5_9EUKA|nr:hypothetical protein SS50377_27605 [Spironucleus salmonicida]|eukprot:EST46617.1 Hypothetical protein SS50377_13421 [Spironucleus salmonicida]
MNITEKLIEIEVEANQLLHHVKSIVLPQPNYSNLQILQLPSLRSILELHFCKMIQNSCRVFLSKKRYIAIKKIKSQRQITQFYGVFSTNSYIDFDDFYERKLKLLDRNEKAICYRISRLVFSGFAAFRGVQMERKQGAKIIKSSHEDLSDSEW